MNISIDPNKLNKTYLKYLSQTSFLIQDSPKLISSLSEKYKLYIITNGFGDVQRKRINNSIIRNYFEKIIISEEEKLQNQILKYLNIP